MNKLMALVLTLLSLNVSAQVFVDAPKEVKKTKALNEGKKVSNVFNEVKTNVKAPDPSPSSDSKGFYSAVLNRNYEMMEMYLARGADINCRNCGFEGRTALLNNVMNVDNSDPKLVKYLLDHGADGNIPDPRGTTALMAAMAPNNIYYNSPSLADIVALLLSAGVNIESADNEGRTAINYIEDTSKSRRLAMLLKAGVNLNNQPNRTGITLLMRAANNCAETEYLEQLLSSGADTNLKSTEGKKAVDYALERATNSNSQKCNNAFKLLSNTPTPGSTKPRSSGR